MYSRQANIAAKLSVFLMLYVKAEGVNDTDAVHKTTIFQIDNSDRMAEPLPEQWRRRFLKLSIEDQDKNGTNQTMDHF